MSNDMNKTVREFYKAVEGVKSKKTGGYDVQATVRRVEDGVAWVHIPDGVDETPALLTINAKEGDVVQVRVVNGRAFLVGNASAPPTDNTEAVKAMGQAGLAAEAASIARQKADEAVEDAATAHEAAMLAKDSADAAQASADAAQTSADNAQTSATTANQAANSALAGLGTVESVLDVVTWFSEHKTATTDTTVQAGKSYYEYDASTGVLTKVDPEGTENPLEEGWYELDEAITNYVSTHLAQTNDGLNVVSSINGWRVLISSGGGNYNAGVYLIDPNGNIAQSTTAAGVDFNTGKPVNIGDSTAYINFDGNGHITVVGAYFTIGGSNNQNGMMVVKNASGTSVGTWDKDGIWTIAGKIGGWDINSAQIRSDVTVGTTKYSSVMQSMDSSASTSRFAFAVVEYANGSTTFTDIPFRVNYDGSLLSTKGTIGGWTIGSSRLESTKTISGTIYNSYIQNMDGTDLTRGAFVLRNSTDGGTTWNYPFLVRYNGEGRIGAWNFNANAFYWGGGWKSTSTAGAYLGINGLSVTGKDFYLIGTGTTSSTLYFGIGSTTEAAYISLESGALCIGGDYISSIDIFKSLNVYGTVRLQATSHDIGLSVATSGNAGIYDYANSGWLVYASTDGVATLGNSTYGAYTYSWADSGHPIVSNGTANHRVSQFYMSSATSLRVNAQGNASAYAFYYITTSSSDIRLKENIKDTETEALPIIDKIKIRQFDWKDGVHQDIGMIADEIEQIDPHLASGGGYDENGNMNVKSIDTFYLTGYLVKAVQELSAEINRMKKGMKAS